MAHVDIGDERPGLPDNPTPGLGIFARPGGFVVNPRGGPLGPVEHCAGMKRNGYGWVVFNAFDGETKPADSDVWRHEADRNGLPWGWWARCYDAGDLEFLAALAQRDVRPLCVFNCEDELNDGTVTIQHLLGVAATLQAQGCAVGVSTVAPLYGDVKWGKLTRAGAVVLPQAFANYDKTLTAQGAHDQAKASGADLVNVTVGLNKTAVSPRLEPKDYEPLPDAWSAYPVETIEKWD